MSNSTPGNRRAAGTKLGPAESRFRAALSRIVAGSTERIEEGSQITQNNVAREAGVYPSALRSSRYPQLVRDIQQAAVSQNDARKHSSSPLARPHGKERRSEKQRYLDMKNQRDQAAAQLVSADTEVLRLMLRVRDLERRIEELSPSPTSPPIELLRLPKR